MDYGSIAFGALLGLLSSLATWWVTRHYVEKRAAREARQAALTRLRVPLTLIRAEIAGQERFWFNSNSVDPILNSMKEEIYRLADARLISEFEVHFQTIRGMASSDGFESHRKEALENLDSLLALVEARR